MGHFTSPCVIYKRNYQETQFEAHLGRDEVLHAVQGGSSSAAQGMKSRSRCLKCIGASPSTAFGSREETGHCGGACEGHSSARPPAPPSSSHPSPLLSIPQCPPCRGFGKGPWDQCSQPWLWEPWEVWARRGSSCQPPIIQALLSSPPTFWSACLRASPILTLFATIHSPDGKTSTHLSPQMNK